MKILHVTPTWFDKSSVIGGGERYPVELAKAQTALGHEVSLVAFGEMDQDHSLDGICVRVIKRSLGTQFSPLGLGLFSEIRKHDIIHCHQFHSLSTNASIVMARLLRKKVFYSDLGGGGWNIGFYINLSKMATAALEISEHAASHQERVPRQSHIIGAGVDVDRFRPDETVVKDDSILFVGRVMPHKGVDVLVRALPENVRLNVVGQIYDEPYNCHLRDLAKDKDVTFCENVSDKELVSYYQKASICVLPSVLTDWNGVACPRSELFGLTLVESLACGTPVIGSDITSIPEIITESCGWLFPSGDARSLTMLIQQALADPEQLRRMGKLGREHVCRHFTWSAVAYKALEAYEE